MHWEIMDEREIGISKHTHWSQISDYRKLAQGMGVYILANDEHEVKYIGWTDKRALADEVDEVLASGKAGDATRIKALYTRDDKLGKQVYKVLLNKYQPPDNLY